MKTWWLCLTLLTACGSAMMNPDGGGTTSGALQPGQAGSGHLAYIAQVRGGRELEITNLTTGAVEYRSNEDDGEVSQFFVSADGSAAVFRSAVKPCVRVALPAGTTSDCTAANTTLAYITGISNDGRSIASTAINATTFQTTRVIFEDGATTELGEAPMNSGSQVSGGGGISPDGEFLYEFRFNAENTNPRSALWKYSRAGGAPTAIFDFTANVRARGVTDVELQLNEAGTRGVFACVDPSQPVAEQISTCMVDLVTGAVTLVPNAVGSMSLDGSRVATVPPFGEGYRVYDFGSTSPAPTITRAGGAVTLSPDASRLGFRLREDNAFYVAATMPVTGGAAVRVQLQDGSSRATPEKLIWTR